MIEKCIETMLATENEDLDKIVAKAFKFDSDSQKAQAGQLYIDCQEKIRAKVDANIDKTLKSFEEFKSVDKEKSLAKREAQIGEDVKFEAEII
jgi:hypothetical protein